MTIESRVAQFDNLHQLFPRVSDGFNLGSLHYEYTRGEPDNYHVNVHAGKDSGLLPTDIEYAAFSSGKMVSGDADMLTVFSMQILFTSGERIYLYGNQNAENGPIAGNFEYYVDNEIKGECNIALNGNDFSITAGALSVPGREDGLGYIGDCYDEGMRLAREMIAEGRKFSAQNQI